MKIQESDFMPIISKCIGCKKVDPQDLPEAKPVEIQECPMPESPEMPKPVLEVPEVRRCVACINPESKWRNGNCNLATHIVKEEAKEVKHVDPIKKSKQMMKGNK